MEHYICTGGCGGVSDEPGVCHDIHCPKHGQRLDKEEYADHEATHHHKRTLSMPEKSDLDPKNAPM